jgi:hypothetical protein
LCTAQVAPLQPHWCHRSPFGAGGACDDDDDFHDCFQDGVMLCVVGPGTSFGEGILSGKPHRITVVTKDATELLRVELKDFKILWEVGWQFVDALFFLHILCVYLFILLFYTALSSCEL